MVQLWHDCGLTRPWNDPQADFLAALVTPSSTVFVVDDGERPLRGSVLAGYDGHRGWIYYLAVAQAHRGEGLARSLMVAAEAWLTAQGAPKVQLMVRQESPVGAFYAALGYQQQNVTVWGRWLT